MKIKKIVKFFISNCSSTLLILFFVFFLSFCSIPGGDDIEFAGIVKNNFSFLNLVTAAGSNGRYLGNAIGLLLSYFSMSGVWWLKTIVYSFSYLLFLYLCSVMISQKRKKECFVFFSVIIFLLPISIYYDPLGYSAAFSNYLLGNIFLLAFIVLSNVYYKNQNNIYIKYLLFIISAISCFFVEHISILICVYSSILCFYIFLTKKINYLNYIIVLLINLVCTALMFMYKLFYKSPTIYDNYRSSIPNSNLIEFIFDNFKLNTKYLLFDNYFLTGLIAFIFIILVLSEIKEKKLNIWTVISCLLLCSGFIVAILNYYGNIENTLIALLRNDFFIAISTVLYLLAMFYLILRYLYKQVKYKVLFLFFSSFFLYAELLVVSPINSRCYFASQVFYCILCALIWFEVISKIICKKIKYIIITFLFVLFCANSVYVLNFMYNRYSIYDMRRDFILEQMDQNKEEIEIPEGNWDFLLTSYGLFYYYEKQNDITFIIIDNDEWMNKYKAYE